MTYVCTRCDSQFLVSPSTGSCQNCGGPLTACLEATVNIENLEASALLGDAASRGSDSRTESHLGVELEGRVVGSYKIEEYVGRGSMASVYRARHELLHRQCALKVLQPALLRRDPTSIDRFFSEARAVAGLVHPHIVTVHNIGQDGELHFIEMEFAAGKALEQLAQENRPLDPIRVLALSKQAVSGLAEAHSKGIVHRDVKPGNILVDARDHAKLADFGLCRKVLSDEKTFQHRELVGTPYYMAPEVFDGAGGSPASDVYSLGISLFSLLCGRFPFSGTTLEELAGAHRKQTVPNILEFRPEAPQEVSEIIERCLAKCPQDRYADGSQLYEALSIVLGGLRDLDDLVRQAVRGLGIEGRRRDGGWELKVELPTGRCQLVRVEESHAGPFSRRLIKIYSICAPLAESYYRRALELNAEIDMGSLAVQQVDGVAHFVMVNSYPRATCDPQELRASVLSIARWSDHVEKVLTGVDYH